MAPGPLAPCPDTPNCARACRTYPFALGALFEKAQDALGELGPVAFRLAAGEKRARAVFRVVLFKDDVTMAVVPQGQERTTVHVRSASRVGRYDFGVNRRRVRRFFRTLEAELSAAASPAPS